MRVRSALLSALFVVSCATHPSYDFQAGDAEGAIERMNAAFERGAAAGNVEPLVGIYAESAVLMPPNAESISDPKGIREFWSGLLAAGRIGFDLITDNVVQSGDLAVERGRYELTITRQDGTKVDDAGKYVVVWRKIEGRWRAIIDIYNSSRPLSAPVQ